MIEFCVKKNPKNKLCKMTALFVRKQKKTTCFRGEY